MKNTFRKILGGHARPVLYGRAGHVRCGFSPEQVCVRRAWGDRLCDPLRGHNGGRLSTIAGFQKTVSIVLILFLACVTAVFFTQGQAQAGGGIKLLRVGTLFPQTGELAFGASNALQGVQIAVELFNENNTHGMMIELISGDAPNPAEGVRVVQQLITRQQVDVIIGTYASAIASAAAPAAEKLNRLYLETTAFAEGITRETGNVLRTTISSRVLGAAAADFILTGLAEKLGVAENDMVVALVYTDDEFGASIADAALGRLLASPARVAVQESYSAATTSDLSSVLLRIKHEKPHAVIHIAQVPDAILFWRQAQQLGVDIPAVIGGGGGYGQAEFVRPLGTNADGIFNVVPPTSGSINVASLSPSARELLSQYQQRLTQRGWTQGPYTDWAFEGTWVFLNEVVPRAASFSIADLMTAAAQVKVAALDSITGFGFEFAESDHEDSGQNLRAIPVVQQWQGGQLRVVYPEALAVADVINVPLPGWAERPRMVDQNVD